MNTSQDGKPPLLDVYSTMDIMRGNLDWAKKYRCIATFLFSIKYFIYMIVFVHVQRSVVIKSII